MKFNGRQHRQNSSFHVCQEIVARMKRLMAVLFLALGLVAPALAVASTNNWYVRPDGGSRFSIQNQNGQCNGKSDVAYPGKGVNQPCAFNDPRYLYSTGGNQAYQWVMAGGDTVLVHGGPYRIGQDTFKGCANFSNGCSMDNSFIPPPPNGTAAAPTTFLGENYANCKTKTSFYGGFTVNGVFNLRGSSFVKLACLDITDHAQCSHTGTKPEPCDGNYGDFAKSGILTDQNTHDITLQDLDIHGFRDNGIWGAVGGLFNVSRVRIAFNGLSGWNFDDGFGTKSVNGKMIWSYVTVEGNGCIEEYPIVHPGFPAGYCYDDGNIGYGDGVGTPDTQIDFNIDHALIRYNTQDGLDILHTTGSTIVLTNSTFYGNMGQQWKLGPMASTLVRNNFTVTNCHRMSEGIADNPGGTWNAGLSDFCRAGAGIQMVQRGDKAGGGNYVVQNNTFVGYAGDAVFEVSACTDSYLYAPTNDCNTPNITFENNLMVGYSDPNYNSGQAPPTGTDGGEKRHFSKISNNIYYNMRTQPSDGVSTNPFLVSAPVFRNEASLDNFDAHLTLLSSNAIGKGMPIAGLTTDLDSVNWGLPPSIGAYEFLTAPVVSPTLPVAPVTGTGNSGSGSATGGASAYSATMQVSVTCTLTGSTLSCATK